MRLASAVWRRLRGGPKPATARPTGRLLVPEVQVVQAGPAQGLRFLANTRAPAFRQMVAGTYDAFLHEALDRAHIEPAMVLDVGAHIGYHGLCFAARYPQSRVVAFEPNPVNADRTTEQLNLNPAISGRMELRREALAEVDGDMDLYASPFIEDQTSSGGHLAHVRPAHGAELYQKAGFQPYRVQVRRLDSLVKEMAWAGIGLIKIDVEGAEEMVLDGGMKTLREQRPVLLIELHSVACAVGVMARLNEVGYVVELLNEEDARRAFIFASPRQV